MVRQLVPAVLAAAASILSLGCNRGEKSEAEAASVTVKVCGIDGVKEAIASAKGKVILIDCWATWCGPCRSSFPKLVQKHRTYAGQGLAVISLSLDKESELDEVIGFLKNNKATFTNLLLKQDGESTRWLAEKLGYEGSIPHAALFDRTGRRVWSGHPLDDELQKRLEAELKK